MSDPYFSCQSAADLDRLDARLADPKPAGFRAECKALSAGARALLKERDELKASPCPNQERAGPFEAADQLDKVHRAVGSPAHQDAARLIRRLARELAEAKDVAADATAAAHAEIAAQAATMAVASAVIEAVPPPVTTMPTAPRVEQPPQQPPIKPGAVKPPQGGTGVVKRG